MERPSALERAFALADAGLSVPEIRKALAIEGYPPGMVSDSVAKQLRERQRAAKARRF
jgi:hypothetical protein